LDIATVAERILAVTGEDTVTIARKYKQAWTGKLVTRILMLTNKLPYLSDASGAFESRFIVLVLTNSFIGREDPKLTTRLLGELPGILNRALDGWDRLNARGHFVQPSSSLNAILDLEEIGSPISTFIAECCDVGTGLSVEIAKLYARWRAWCFEQGREHPGTRQNFTADLRAAIPALRTSRPWADGGARPRHYDGISLKIDPLQVAREKAIAEKLGLPSVDLSVARRRVQHTKKAASPNQSPLVQAAVRRRRPPKFDPLQ
jgi:putative DNA primase/helicase